MDCYPTESPFTSAKDHLFLLLYKLEKGFQKKPIVAFTNRRVFILTHAQEFTLLKNCTESLRRSNVYIFYL